MSCSELLITWGECTANEMGLEALMLISVSGWPSRQTSPKRVEVWPRWPPGGAIEMGQKLAARHPQRFCPGFLRGSSWLFDPLPKLQILLWFSNFQGQPAITAVRETDMSLQG